MRVRVFVRHPLRNLFLCVRNSTAPDTAWDAPTGDVAFQTTISSEPMASSSSSPPVCPNSELESVTQCAQRLCFARAGLRVVVLGLLQIERHSSGELTLHLVATLLDQKQDHCSQGARWRDLERLTSLRASNELAMNGFYEWIVYLGRGGRVYPMCIFSHALLSSVPDADRWAHLAYQNNSAGLEQYMIAHQLSVNERSYKQDRLLWTPLHCAARGGAVRTVEWLLQNGADPSASGANGETALHVAAIQNRDTAQSVIQLLFSAGAPLLAQDRKGRTCLHHAANAAPEYYRRLLLMLGDDPLADVLRSVPDAKGMLAKDYLAPLPCRSADQAGPASSDRNATTATPNDASCASSTDGAATDAYLPLDSSELLDELQSSSVMNLFLAAKWNQVYLRNGLRLCQAVSKGTHQLDLASFSRLLQVFSIDSEEVAKRLFRACLDSSSSSSMVSTCQVLILLASCKLPATAEWDRQRTSIVFRMYATVPSIDAPSTLGKHALRQMITDASAALSKRNGGQVDAFTSCVTLITETVARLPSPHLGEESFFQLCTTVPKFADLVACSLPHVRFSATAGNVLLRQYIPVPSSSRSPAASPRTDPPEQVLSRARFPPRAVDGARSFDHGSLTTEKIGGRLMLGVQLEAPPSEPASELAGRVIKHFLVDKAWHGSGGRDRFTLLNSAEIIQVCQQVRLLLKRQETLVQVKPPCRVFGDLHGQLQQLLDLFERYGSPNHYNGDVRLIHYVFNGDFVDRGPNSLEVVLLLFSLKVMYPTQITLLRGNHEDRVVNAAYGFREELENRMEFGLVCWKEFNRAFEWLPLCAQIGSRVLCMHGGIGDLTSLTEIRRISRPLESSSCSPAVTSLLWSDPTSSDAILGLHANLPRGGSTGGVVSFGPDRVHQFCERNNIDIIIRSHQCVPSGYRFNAGGKMVTVFSAANYCHTKENDGALLEISQDLVVMPRVLPFRRTRS